MAGDKKIKMKILFICKYNAFRSRVAEEYFRKINSNKKKVRVMNSKGIIMGGDSDNVQRGEAKKLLGVNIAKRKPFPLTIADLREADRIIVVANDIPKIIFNFSLAPIMKKVVIWRIRDEQKKNRKNISKIILAIKRKVDKLNKRLS
jgi:protein-tyrosine-phosphatase